MGGQARWWETRRFAVFVILASALPLLLPHVPPLTDLPGHIGRYRVMLGTDADTLSQWYRFDWRLVGNLGVDLIVAGLAPLFGLELTVKLAVIAIQLLTVTGILWISKEVHGRTTVPTLFALPLAYNYAFHFGFVNYSLAMALALNAFALWLRLGRQGRIGLRAAVFVPISFILWIAHVVGWGALGVLAFSAETIRQRDLGHRWLPALARAAFGCVPLSLPFALLLFWRTGGGGLTERFFLIAIKLAWLATVFRDRWAAFDLASAALVAGLLYKGVRDSNFGHSRHLALSALLLLAVFFLLPFLLFGSAYADMRLAPYVVILGLVSMRAGESVSARELGRLAMLGLAFFAARTAGTTASYWLYSRSWDRNLAALDHLPHGARLVSFVGQSCARPWANTRLDHLPGFAIARRAAFSNDQWRMAGAPLLRVTAPGLGDFANDPSQIVLSAPCEAEPDLVTLNQSLAAFPRSAFDYVWLIDPPAYDSRLTMGMTPIWRDGSSVLFRVDKPASPAPAR